MLVPVEASTQGGCFTYPQAWSVGWTYKLLASAVRRSQLHRVRRGVWIEQALWDALDERAKHLVAVRADLLSLPDGWRAGRCSAAIAMGLPLIGALPKVPQLIADKDAQSTSRHRKVAALPASHTAVRDGIPLSTLARTGVDLARSESFLSAVVTLDAILGLGVPREALEEVLETVDHWPGVVAARAAVAFADGLSESALESLSRVRCHQRSLPRPELQVEIWRGRQFLGRADKLWREQRVVGEDDGMEKFGSTDDERQQSFKTTYQRGIGIGIEDGGLVLARWDWDAAWKAGGELVEERVRRAFAGAEHTVLDPDIRFVPTTVEDRLRRMRRLAG